jgi:ABC-type phosphate transport system substrate-binding protein
MKRLAAPLAGLAFATAAHAAETTGAGSTFVSPIIAKWAELHVDWLRRGHHGYQECHR